MIKTTGARSSARRTLLLGLSALALAGCNFLGGSSSTTGSGSATGYGVVSLHNCSNYGISVYRQGPANQFEQVGTSGTYAVNNAPCDEATASPLQVALVPGQTNTIWVLYTDTQCTDNPQAVHHCIAEQIVRLGTSSGPTDVHVLTRQ